MNKSTIIIQSTVSTPGQVYFACMISVMLSPLNKIRPEKKEMITRTINTTCTFSSQASLVVCSWVRWAERYRWHIIRSTLTNLLSLIIFEIDFFHIIHSQVHKLIESLQQPNETICRCKEALQQYISTYNNDTFNPQLSTSIEPDLNTGFLHKGGTLQTPAIKRELATKFDSVLHFGGIWRWGSVMYVS